MGLPDLSLTRLSIESLLRRAARRGDQPALRDDTGWISHAAVEAASRQRAAALLSIGLRGGDRVAVRRPNGIDAVVDFLAILRAGLVWVGLSPALTGTEADDLIRRTAASVVLGDTDLPPAHVAGVPPTDPHAAAVISFTSGSSGLPKGVVHSQHTTLLPAVAAAWRGAGRGITGMYLPLSSVNMMILGPLTTLVGGGCCVLTASRHAAYVAELVRRHAIDALPLAIPTVIDWLATDGGQPAGTLPTLREPVVGGSGAPEWVFDAYAARFGHRLTLGYGLTEAPTSVCREPAHLSRRRGTSGVALDHLRVTVAGPDGAPLPVGEVGEICVGPRASGPWAAAYRPMLGYWDDPTASATALSGGVLHTGDVGWLDADGLLTVGSRRSDLIVRGGSNISPVEIEAVIRELDGVADVAVVGVDDPRLGQVPAAVVAGRAAADEVRSHCAARLAAFKRPAIVVVTSAVPRLANGKVDQQATISLAQQAGAGTD